MISTASTFKRPLQHTKKFNLKSKKMKTSKNYFKNLITSVLLITALIIIVSCKEKNEKIDNKKVSSSVSNSKVEVPKEDIITATFLGDLKVVKQHINAGSDLNIKDQYGSTPLIVAATFGKTEVAKVLINGGADLNLTGSDGSTALHTAAFFCRTEIVKALIKAGVNKNIKNQYGSTALESVLAPFESVKPIYEEFNKNLGPMGLKLDYAYLEKTRPVIADLLK